MLAVGLTGGLGSGKSTVCSFLRELGAHVMEADAVGRELMEPGGQVFRQIVDRFGAQFVLPEGTLDRRALARHVFAPESEERELAALNAIVHPPVLEAHRQWLTTVAASDPAAVAVYESALLFEAEREVLLRRGAVLPREQDESAHAIACALHRRFEVVMLVTAPEELKLARFLERAKAGRSLSPAEEKSVIADARARLGVQMPDAKKAPCCDYVLVNVGSKQALQQSTAVVFAELRERALQSAKETTPRHVDISHVQRSS